MMDQLLQLNLQWVVHPVHLQRTKRSPPRMNSRPDISMARGDSRAEFNDAENMESNFASVNEKRKEMRGPNSGDLRDILAGLKTKQINIKENKS